MSSKNDDEVFEEGETVKESEQEKTVEEEICEDTLNESNLNQTFEKTTYLDSEKVIRLINK